RCGKILKSLFLERRAPSPVARLVSGSCGQADFRAEHEPVRRLALCNLWRPGEPPSPYDGSVHLDGVGPVEGDRLLGRAMSGERICKRVHRGVEDKARFSQRLFRLEY